MNHCLGHEHDRRQGASGHAQEVRAVNQPTLPFPDRRKPPQPPLGDYHLPIALYTSDALESLSVSVRARATARSDAQDVFLRYSFWLSQLQDLVLLIAERQRAGVSAIDCGKELSLEFFAWLNKEH